MANNDVIEKWVEALESGAFQQGTGRLKKAYFPGDVERYCCLGVLCELAVQEGVIPYHHYFSAELTLPRAVVDWAGLPAADPYLEYPGNGTKRQASAWNDSEGFTFTQIAALIRNTYLENADAAA